MIEAVALTQLAVIVVLIWHSLRQQAQHAETILHLLTAQDADRDRDRELAQAERKAWAHERALAHPDLTELVQLVDRVCQRLQAPEAAAVEHAMAQPLPPMPAAVPPDDDAAFWEAQIAGLAKDDLADVAMDAEVAGGE